jgi:hypothetical protein
MKGDAPVRQAPAQQPHIVKS